MENAPYQKLLTTRHILLGLVLTFLFYVMMSIVLVPYTFSEDRLIAQLQACLTAMPIAAVFWFAYHMFMLVLVDQIKRKKEAQ
jgi:hypothetical protein